MNSLKTYEVNLTIENVETFLRHELLINPYKQKIKKLEQAGAELSQAQPKLGLRTFVKIRFKYYV